MTMPIDEPSWMVSVRCTHDETRVLVTEDHGDVLKARLCPEPGHPRALLTLCEGLALWHGLPLCVAVSADDDAREPFERVFYAGGLVELQSPLVRLEHRPPQHQGRRLRGRGLGDFRGLRRHGGER
jgi:hypothetical protein